MVKYTPWICEICGSDDTYYMALDSVWSAVKHGYRFLCVGCLSELIGRALTKEDFSNYPINNKMKRRYE